MRHLAHHDNNQPRIITTHQKLVRKLIAHYRNIKHQYWQDRKTIERVQYRILHHAFAILDQISHDMEESYEYSFLDCLKPILISDNKETISGTLHKKLSSGGDAADAATDVAHMTGMFITIPMIDIDADDFRIFSIMDINAGIDAGTVNTIIGNNIQTHNVSDVIQYVSRSSLFSDSWYEKQYLLYKNDDAMSEALDQNLAALIRAGLVRDLEWAKSALFQCLASRPSPWFTRLLSIYSLNDAEAVLNELRGRDRELALWYLALHGSLQSARYILEDLEEHGLDSSNGRAVEWLFGKTHYYQLRSMQDTKQLIKYLNETVNSLYRHAERLLSGVPYNSKTAVDIFAGYAGQAARDINDLISSYENYEVAVNGECYSWDHIVRSEHQEHRPSA